VRKILKAGVIEEGQYHASKEGTMQGVLCEASHNPPCGAPDGSIF